MATRQYIGARYVPKFYENSDNTSEWRSGVIYEPLTIVTYNGNSYTSKKIVPAEIGNPSANPSHWVATGVYNQQVETLIEEVNGLSEEVGTFSDSVEGLENSREQNIAANKKICFVADSFGTFTNPSFIEYAAQNIGCEYVKIAAPSIGFYANGSLTFENLLRDNLPNNRESFTDVIVCGGNNDLSASGTNLSSAISSFITYCSSQFSNAKIHIGFNARRINDTPSNAEAMTAYNYQLNANKHGASYFDLRGWLHDSDYFADASLHPNASGQLSLAQGIAQYIQNGSTANFSGLSFMGLTANDGFTISPNTVTMQICGYDVRMIFSNTFMTLGNLAKNTDVELANVGKSLFESKTAYPTKMTLPAVITLQDNSEIMGVVSITVRGGKFRVSWDGPANQNAKYALALKSEFHFSVFDT